jgi:hypothetical protein
MHCLAANAMTSLKDPSPDERRRGFLKNLGGVAAVPAPSSVLVSGDLYVNNKLGFAFRKPTGWRFEHLSTFADLRNEYDFASPDADQVEELKSGPLPLAVISQAPVLRTLTCSMTIYAEQNPLRDNEHPIDAAPDIVRGISSFLEKFQVVLPARSVFVAGAQAIEFAATFIYRDRLGNSGPVRHRGLVVLRHPILYTLNMLDVPVDGIVAEAEFNQIRQSIVFA